MKIALSFIVFFILSTKAFCIVVPLENPDVPSGTWAISKIVYVGGGLSTETIKTTQAMTDRIAPFIEARYPPVGDYALVRISGTVTNSSTDTIIFPAEEESITQIPINQRQSLADKFRGYSYIEADGTEVTKSDFSLAVFSGTSTVREMVLILLQQLAHSKFRTPKVSLKEDHNTEYLETFDTDPYSGPRWTDRIQSASWDSGNGELDVLHVGQATLIERTDNTPGSIEHEAQVTFAIVNAEPEGVGAGARVEGGTNNDFYSIGLWHTSDVYEIHKRVGGAVTQLTTYGETIDPAVDSFFTTRIAAEGAAGSNVSLSAWRQTHGLAKPSDPGWIGIDGSPTLTYSDTAADRLDDSVHDACGIAGRNAINTDFDTRHDYHKQRAISDRVTGLSYPLPVILRGGVFRGGVFK